MAEIIKCYKERMPAHRFIGKMYTDDDRVNGSYGSKWREWFQNGYFETLEKLGSLSEGGDAYLGFMKWSKSGFEYWIGMFFPENTPVPEGYGFIDMPASNLGTCWIYGSEQNDKIYGMHDACCAEVVENQFEIRDDFGNGMGEKEYFFFERYNCPRFTTPDDKGKVILDYCIYVK